MEFLRFYWTVMVFNCSCLFVCWLVCFYRSHVQFLSSTFWKISLFAIFSQLLGHDRIYPQHQPVEVTHSLGPKSSQYIAEVRSTLIIRCYQFNRSTICPIIVCDAKKVIKTWHFISKHCKPYRHWKNYCEPLHTLIFWGTQSTWIAGPQTLVTFGKPKISLYSLTWTPKPIS